MGFICSIIIKIIKLILILGIFVGIIVLIPNLPPYTEFSSIELATTQPRVGTLAPNGALNNAEKMYLDKVLGPEAFQVVNGELYTSQASGEIVKVSPGGHVTFVTKVGQPCTGLTQEHICGRPLGFEIDPKKNVLYVADAYHGIWKTDLKTDKKQLLVSPRVEISGRVPRLFNSIALAKNGDFYWTDSTSDFSLKDGAIGMLSDPSGRLFYYNAAKNESKVLIDNLWFANGVVISPDNQFVVVVETAKFRLLKYYIDGPRKGESEVFAAGLPGAPDNVRVLPDGSGVLVGLYVVFDEEHPLLMRSMAQTPVIRKFLARLQSLIQLPFAYLNTVYPHFLFEDIEYYIGHFKSISGLSPPMSGLLQINWSGHIVASYYNTDKSVVHISDAVVYNNKLHLGCPHLQNFIGSVAVPPQLQKAFASTSNQKTQEKPKVHEKEVPKVAKPVEAKPATTTPKPTTTTTPKPTTTTQKPTTTTTTPKPTTTTQKPTTTTTTPKPTTTTQKPTTTTTPKPTTTTPKPTTKPAPAPLKTETKATPPKQPAKQPEPKVKNTPKSGTKPAQPKPAETKPKVDKPAENAAKKENTGSPKVPHEKPVREQIPIEEEIPSDTAKPNKETLKVIKKGGPTEIPNPGL